MEDKDTRNMIMVTLGTGVGGGIIINEKILTGAHGAGGELGHACVNAEETVACNCGNKGCLEQYASATGIARLAKQALESFYRGITASEKRNGYAKDVFDAYKEQDSLAKRHCGRILRISWKSSGSVCLCSKSRNYCIRRRCF